jgi:hypothetical protein
MVLKQERKLDAEGAFWYEFLLHRGGSGSIQTTWYQLLRCRARMLGMSHPVDPFVSWIKRICETTMCPRYGGFGQE